MTWVTFLRQKSETLEKFKIFKSMVVNQVDARIKCLRSDRGGEFTSNEFDIFYEEHGIRRHCFASRTHRQNGVVERNNRIVLKWIELQ